MLRNAFFVVVCNEKICQSRRPMHLADFQTKVSIFVTIHPQSAIFIDSGMQSLKQQLDYPPKPRDLKKASTLQQ